MYNPDDFKKLYPEWYPTTTLTDIIISIFIFSLFFVIPYIYIKLVEEKLIIKYIKAILNK